MLTSAKERLVLLHGRLHKIDEFDIVDCHGTRQRSFKGDIKSLKGYTHGEIINLAPKLLIVIGRRDGEFISKETTPTLRKILTHIVNLIGLFKHLEWNEHKMRALREVNRDLGPLIRKLCEPLDIETGTKGSPDLTIGTHNLLHFELFIVLFGPPKLFDTEVFESAHRIYKQLYARTTRKKGSGSDGELFVLCILLRRIEEIHSTYERMHEGFTPNLVPRVAEGKASSKMIKAKQVSVLPTFASVADNFRDLLKSIVSPDDFEQIRHFSLHDIITTAVTGEVGVVANVESVVFHASCRLACTTEDAVLRRKHVQFAMTYARPDKQTVITTCPGESGRSVLLMTVNFHENAHRNSEMFALVNIFEHGESSSSGPAMNYYTRRSNEKVLSMSQLPFPALMKSNRYRVLPIEDISEKICIVPDFSDDKSKSYFRFLC